MAVLEQGSFRYANPSTIHWGAGCVTEGLGEAVRSLGARRVFLITTRSVAENAAVTGPIQAQLGNRLVGGFDGVSQHTPARSIAQASAAAREAGADLLLALGGGSAVDGAKAVAFSLASGLDLLDPAAPRRAATISLANRDVLPQVAVPTTLSAAELSHSAGYSADGSREKVGVRAPELLPAAVFYDAALTLYTPLQLWLASGLRAVDHAVEGLLADGSHPFSDTLALEGLRRLRAGLLATCNDPRDLGARTESQLGAWFSYTLPGPSMIGLSHTLGKRLGSRHGIPHGVTSCLLLPHVMRYLAPRTAAAQARIATALGVDTSGLTPEQAADAAADAVAELIARLGLPRHLADFHLTGDDLQAAARPVASPAYPLADLLAVLQAAQ